MLVFFDRLRVKNLLFDVPDVFLARPVAAEEARFVLAHLTRDFVHHRVDRGVKIVRLFASLDRDVVGADEHDLGPVPVFFHLRE